MWIAIILVVVVLLIVCNSGRSNAPVPGGGGASSGGERRNSSSSRSGRSSAPRSPHPGSLSYTTRSGGGKTAKSASHGGSHGRNIPNSAKYR